MLKFICFILTFENIWDYILFLKMIIIKVLIIFQK